MTPTPISEVEDRAALVQGRRALLEKAVGDRDEAIVAAWREGHTQQALAKATGLSRRAIRLITHGHDREAQP